MASIIELLSVLVVSFVFNIVPFVGPSNLLIATNASVLMPGTDPFVPVVIGFLVALGSTSAKLVHYIISFFVGEHLNEKRKKQMDVAVAKLHGWAFFAVFIAAATPIPDEPVVVPLGLMRYSVVKFTSAFFAGKLIICVAGAYLGVFGQQFLGGYLTQDALAVVSVVLTIAITVVLLKVDPSKVSEKALKRLGLVKNGKDSDKGVQQ